MNHIIDEDTGLSGFFQKHRAEVTDVYLEEYDEEAVRQLMREEAAEEAHEKGLAEGLEQGRITMLFDAVNASVMTVTDAAKLSNTTEEDFLKKLAAYND